MLTVGSVVSEEPPAMLTLTLAVRVLPAASRAVAVKVWLPAEAPTVFQERV